MDNSSSSSHLQRSLGTWQVLVAGVALVVAGALGLTVLSTHWQSRLAMQPTAPSPHSRPQPNP